MDYEIYDLCDVKNPMDMNIELKEIMRPQVSDERKRFAWIMEQG